MSIFSAPPPAVTTAQAAADGLRQFNGDMLLQMVGSLRESFGRVWFRRDGVSAQEMFDDFGPNAAKLFAGAQILITAINDAAALNGQTIADYLDPKDFTAPLPYTINADGTVTVHAAPDPAPDPAP